jgi:quercetin dioxygenase-like cupin family protein
MIFPTGFLADHRNIFPEFQEFQRSHPSSNYSQHHDIDYLRAKGHNVAATRANWAEIPPEEVYPGITRQVIQGEKQTMVRYVYAPESVFPEHHHPQEQITTVLTGRIEFDIAGDTVTFGPGDVGVIPSDTPHGARVIGDETVETINTLSPRRDESPGPGSN